jgi:acyl carrier protein
MKRSRDEILRDLIELLRQLADDWEYSGDITEQTRLLADLGLESLDVVVLGTAVQEHYQQILPFSEFFAELGQRDARDVTIGEWADFIYAHLDKQPRQAQAGMVLS